MDLYNISRKSKENPKESDTLLKLAFTSFVSFVKGNKGSES
jgi:hypothetical protein